MVLLRPTYLIDGDITDIDLDRLAADGIKGIIFDLDSTLVAPKSGVLTDDVSAWLKEVRDRFKVAVVSNNKRESYLEQVKDVLNMPLIFFAAKPSRKGFFKALEFLDLKPHEV